MHNKILTFGLLIINSITMQAQFHTITKESEIDYSGKRTTVYNPDLQDATKGDDGIVLEKDVISVSTLSNTNDSLSSPKCNGYTLPKKGFEYAKARGRKPRNKEVFETSKPIGRSMDLPELTIPNLYAEIKKNNIKYPKIVLAQAILETGWFKSSVCRNKNNLFGLTNPRTKTYYEFDHWTESVTAYRTKVQYKYKGGNYLLWLRDIGYAEDKGYMQAVIRVLKQL